MNQTPEELAEEAYETYCQAVGGVAHNGLPLPGWEEFSADPAKTKQSNGWLAVGDLIHAKLNPEPPLDSGV